MSEKAKALVAETVDQLNKLPDSKKDKAKQMMVAFAAETRAPALPHAAHQLILP